MLKGQPNSGHGSVRAILIRGLFPADFRSARCCGFDQFPRVYTPSINDFCVLVQHVGVYGHIFQHVGVYGHIFQHVGLYRRNLFNLLFSGAEEDIALFQQYARFIVWGLPGHATTRQPA
jgi:hypothetical protein